MFTDDLNFGGLPANPSAPTTTGAARADIVGAIWRALEARPVAPESTAETVGRMADAIVALSAPTTGAAEEAHDTAPPPWVALLIGDDEFAARHESVLAYRAAVLTKLWEGKEAALATLAAPPARGAETHAYEPRDCGGTCTVCGCGVSAHPAPLLRQAREQVRPLIEREREGEQITAEIMDFRLGAPALAAPPAEEEIDEHMLRGLRELIKAGHRAVGKSGFVLDRIDVEDAERLLAVLASRSHSRRDGERVRAVPLAEVHARLMQDPEYRAEYEKISRPVESPRPTPSSPVERKRANNE